MTTVFPSLVRESQTTSRWSEPTVVEDAIEVAGVRILRAGLSCSDGGGMEATGSAASTNEPPRTRARFELLERMAIGDAIRAVNREWTVRDAHGGARDKIHTEMLFPSTAEHERYRHARSNGTALHRTWKEACDAALAELVERHRILHSWFGGCAPTRLDVSLPEPLDVLTTIYDWEAYEFAPVCPADQRHELVVTAIFGFPRSHEHPLLMGLGARPEARRSLEASAKEALQRLAFVAGEEIPDAPPEPAPTPLYHLDHFLFPGHHAFLRRWLDGGHTQYGPPPRAPESTTMPGFVRLPIPAEEGGLHVAKAVGFDLIPLAFGAGPDWLVEHMPPDLRIHPIP